MAAGWLRVAWLPALAYITVGKSLRYPLVLLMVWAVPVRKHPMNGCFRVEIDGLVGRRGVRPFGPRDSTPPSGAPVQPPIDAIAVAVQTPVDAVAAPVQAPVDAVAAPVQPPVDAVAASIETIRETLSTGVARVFGTAVQAPVDAVAAPVQAPVDAVAAAVQAPVDAVPAAIQAPVDTIAQTVETVTADGGGIRGAVRLGEGDLRQYRERGAGDQQDQGTV